MAVKNVRGSRVLDEIPFLPHIIKNLESDKLDRSTLFSFHGDY